MQDVDIYESHHSSSELYLFYAHVLCGFKARKESILKEVGNEKVGGSRRWHMIDIGLGQW
jgi:hypothetical protein